MKNIKFLMKRIKRASILPVFSTTRLGLFITTVHYFRHPHLQNNRVTHVHLENGCENG